MPSSSSQSDIFKVLDVGSSLETHDAKCGKIIIAAYSAVFCCNKLMLLSLEGIIDYHRKCFVSVLLSIGVGWTLGFLEIQDTKGCYNQIEILFQD